MTMLLGCLVALIVKGTTNAGGMDQVWQTADEGGRLDLTKYVATGLSITEIRTHENYTYTWAEKTDMGGHKYHSDGKRFTGLFIAKKMQFMCPPLKEQKRP